MNLGLSQHINAFWFMAACDRAMTLYRWRRSTIIKGRTFWSMPTAHSCLLVPGIHAFKSLCDCWTYNNITKPNPGIGIFPWNGKFNEENLESVQPSVLNDSPSKLYDFATILCQMLKVYKTACVWNEKTYTCRIVWVGFYWSSRHSYGHPWIWRRVLTTLEI